MWGWRLRRAFLFPGSSYQSCQAVIDYSNDRYAKLALEMAEKCTDPQRKAELLVIASNFSKVPEKGAMEKYNSSGRPKSSRITGLVEQL